MAITIPDDIEAAILEHFPSMEAAINFLLSYKETVVERVESPTNYNPHPAVNTGPSQQAAEEIEVESPLPRSPHKATAKLDEVIAQAQEKVETEMLTAVTSGAVKARPAPPKKKHSTPPWRNSAMIDVPTVKDFPSDPCVEKVLENGDPVLLLALRYAYATVPSGLRGTNAVMRSIVQLKKQYDTWIDENPEISVELPELVPTQKSTP